jgi:hypothetical protein
MFLDTNLSQRHFAHHKSHKPKIPNSLISSSVTQNGDWNEIMSNSGTTFCSDAVPAYVRRNSCDTSIQPNWTKHMRKTADNNNCSESRYLRPQYNCIRCCSHTPYPLTLPAGAHNCIRHLEGGSGHVTVWDKRQKGCGRGVKDE